MLCLQITSYVPNIFFMTDFDWLLECVEGKMDVSQRFWDDPRICVLYINPYKPSI